MFLKSLKWITYYASNVLLLILILYVIKKKVIKKLIKINTVPLFRLKYETRTSPEQNLPILEEQEIRSSDRPPECRHDDDECRQHPWHKVIVISYIKMWNSNNLKTMHLWLNFLEYISSPKNVLCIKFHQVFQ